jgi:tRNA dimethylallyltransferase
VAELVIAIFGPTASGKSAVAEKIGRRIPAELVSADSMQVYSGLRILTNQSPGRLVGIWGLDHEASVGEYQELAHAAIDEVLAAGRTPIVVGGTGLYFRAALADLELPPAPALGERERLERLYDRIGGERAHELLARAVAPEPAVAEHELLLRRDHVRRVRDH